MCPPDVPQRPQGPLAALLLQPSFRGGEGFECGVVRVAAVEIEALGLDTLWKSVVTDRGLRGRQGGPDL
jgi:hypothetical protein